MAKHFFIPSAPASGQIPVFAKDQPILAPLAGYSDLPFRLLCREQGAAICVTEMVSAKGLLYKSPGTGDLLISQPEDQPLIVQLFGGEPEVMGQAVATLRQYGYKYFDCNMGCPVRKVLKQKSGAALMADPERAFAIASAMLAAAREKIAGLEDNAWIGFKLRLPPKADAITAFAKRLEDLGAAWICLHPRTCADRYGGRAKHEFTAAIANALEIPVIASGDMLTGALGWQVVQETGAAAAMYARGALANPAIFAGHKTAASGSQPVEQSLEDLARIIRRHIDLSRQYGEKPRAFVKMRSIIPRYVKGLRGVGGLRQRLCQCQDWQALETVLADFLNCPI